jgi:hypothetical protein
MIQQKQEYVVACVFSKKAQWYGFANANLKTLAPFKCKFGMSPVFGFIIEATDEKDAQDQLQKRIPAWLKDQVDIVEVQKYDHKVHYLKSIPRS